MASIETINVGTTPNDGTGDSLRDSFIICNNNFSFLNSIVPNTSNANLTANITSTGTSTFNYVTASNIVTGNATASNLSAINVTTANVTGSLIGNTGTVLVGTLTTAAQTNITQVGTLTGLTISGTLNGVSIQGTTIGNSSSSLSGTLLTAAQPNITSFGPLTSDITFGTNLANISCTHLNLGAIVAITNVVDNNFNANTDGNLQLDLSYYSNKFRAVDSNANVNISVTYSNVSSGQTYYVAIRNRNASRTANVILPNSNNNKGSNVVTIAAGVTSSFVFRSFDDTSANVVVTATNS